MKLVVIMYFVQEVTLQEQNDFIYEKQLICAYFMLKLKPLGKMILKGLKLQLEGGESSQLVTWGFDCLILCKLIFL